jgi:hypothetical protein
MRIKLVTALFLLSCLVLAVPAGATSHTKGQTNGSGKETFSALADILPSGATRNVTIYIDSYSSAQEEQQLQATLNSGGPDAFLEALHKLKPIGRIEREGTVGFYDFKMIISMPTPNGRQILAITDRPMGFREVARDSISTEYPSGILQLDLKDNKKGKEDGEGTLIYAAQLKDLNLDKLNIDNYSVDPIRLLGVHQL